MKIDPRFLTDHGPEIFTGNESLLKGCLEATGGVHLLGGYPGSPIAGFFDAMAQIKDLLIEKGIRAVMNNNEALASAMLNGSQVAGCRGLIVMKSVGVHVAADALALGNLAGAHPNGGAVVVYGDDPWSDSTQVASDSRFISRHLHIPVIEPATPQEVKDYVDLAMEVSRSAELYSGYVLTTNLADGGGTVQCRQNQFPEYSTRRQFELVTEAIDTDKYVLLPPRTWWQEESLPQRFERAIAAASRVALNRILHRPQERRPVGFVTSGLAYAYLVQALEELGLAGEFPILKFGLSYPIDGGLVRELAGLCERIVVVEERRAFLEEQVARVVLEDRQSGGPAGGVELWGKKFPGGLEGIPALRGLHPSILIDRLVPLLKLLNGSPRRVAMPGGPDAPLEREAKTIDSTAHVDVGSLPLRLPTFCPGCPHRDTADVCLEIKKSFTDSRYMWSRHKRPPTDLMFHGDTGCYTMLMYPPNAPLMHDYSGMGLGGGTGSGTDPFIRNKQVVFMGDGTFFHSGQLAISNAIKLGQDITFIILDNSTTAMTGHQPTAGVNYDIIGNPTPVQDIEDYVNGMAGDSGLTVVRADPEKRRQYRRLLEETFLADGVKVVIADKECGITRGRRKRRAERAVRKRLGYLPSWQHMNINQEICRFCLTCAEMTGCPGLKHVQTDYGPKMDTDITWCVDDGACERLGACSAFERVTIKRKRPPRWRVPELGLEKIPEPPKRPVGDLWRCCLAGVGGMGIGVATSIVVRAGHNEGYEVIFVDKKGLAIRNGGVVSQVVYNIGHKDVSGVIPYGKADLLVGIDILEAARTLDPKGRFRIATKDRTAAVINTDKIPTIRGLMGQEDFDVEQLEKLIRSHTRSDDYLARNISRICEKYLGSKLYANIMMLGFAFQKGLIPVSMHSMAWAIKDTIGTDVRKNLYAFNMGRKLVVSPDLFQGPPRRTQWRDTLEEKCRYTIRRYRKGQRLAGELRELAAGAVASANELDEPLKRAIVVRIYDCMRWGAMPYARRYAQGVLNVYARDRAEFAYAATRAVVFNLANAMLIKDGVFLAELATSPEKRARDRRKYNVNPANGDRIRYKHLWHWRMQLGPWEFELGVAVYDWMLAVLKRSRYLRRILPAWHRSEKQYLAAYERRIAEFESSSPMEYFERLKALESPRCMDCTNPRCLESGCPLHSHVPQWVRLAYQGRWREASQELHRANNFPEFTSQICPAPCQASCKQGLSGYPVQIRFLEGQIVQRAFAEGWIGPQIAARRSERRVAVIGSGPAGLACAQQLARAGHDVVVFEKSDRPGGMLRYGIPDFRLDKDCIDRRVEQLRREGVSFRTGADVGAEQSAAALLEDFDAVCLATGAHKPRDLDVPGRRQEGIHLAMDLLAQQNRRVAGEHIPDDEAIFARDKVVAVIGGGETGDDCVETVHLQGAKEIYQFEILPAPARAAEAFEGDRNIHRRWSVKTTGFSGNNGRVSELSAVAVEWVNSPTGSRMQEAPGGEFRVKTDMVILATGFEPAVSEELIDQLGIETDEVGRPVVEDHQTSTPGVFVAGDLATGPGLVVTAIDSGRKAAERIDKYLAETPLAKRSTVVAV